MKQLKILVVMMCLMLMNINALAYDDKNTHPQITKEAISKSQIDSYLKSYLGLPVGVGTIYNGKSVSELLQSGSTKEDSPLWRAMNHFWNPLNNSGLYYLLIPFNGNRDWAMGVHDGNEYSWVQARQAYYAALTSPTDSGRETNFILMYESLGHIMHLIEDMGSPAHTRNDMSGHLYYTEFDIIPPKIPFGNLYEFWVEEEADTPGSKYIADLCSEQGINIPEFERAEDYWDAEVYDGTNPEVTMPFNGEEQAGLAEYCNANFLSECAMFTNHFSPDDNHYFPYPRETSLSSLEFIPEIVTAEDGKDDTVRHLRKDRDGEDIDKFVGAKYMWTILEMKSETEFTEAYKLGFKLDDSVHDAYAEKLIPKAAVYAAGVLDYFFRGSIEITLPDNGVYAFLDSEPSDPSVQGFNHITIMARNNSPDEELMMTEGSIDLVVKYRISEVDPFINHTPYPGLCPEVHYMTASSGVIRDIPREVPARLEFDLPEDIPLWATDVSLQVIYNGKLIKGSDDENAEYNAVCVGYKDISEPTPLDIFNNTDFQCMYDNWCYTDVSLTPDAAEQGYEFAGAVLANECAGDCSDTPACEWLFDYIKPKTTETIYIRFSSSDNPRNASSNENEHLSEILNLEAGKFKRLFFLSEYEFSVDVYAPGWINDGYTINKGIMNQMECSSDLITGDYLCIRHYPLFEDYRNRDMWIAAYFRNYSVYDVNGCPDLDMERDCNILDITVGINPMQ